MKKFRINFRRHKGSKEGADFFYCIEERYYFFFWKTLTWYTNNKSAEDFLNKHLGLLDNSPRYYP